MVGVRARIRVRLYFLDEHNFRRNAASPLVYSSRSLGCGTVLLCFRRLRHDCVPPDGWKSHRPPQDGNAFARLRSV